MSRGRRGAYRGGRRGPDLSWDDDETPSTPVSNRPGPLFPPVHLPTPKSLNQNEIASVRAYLNVRDRIRNGPYYSVLDPSSRTAEKGKADDRSDFDPFNDQDKYSARYHKKRRTAPDLSDRNYPLSFFPRELWAALDPNHKSPLWRKSGKEPASEAPKRKRAIVTEEEEGDEAQPRDLASESDSSEIIISGRKKRDPPRSRQDGAKLNQTKQKRGLDAEDDYPEVDQNEEEEGGGEDAPVDSEFSESDDGGGDDYNAENYFDTGEGDEDEGGGGDDDGGFY